MSIYKKSSMVIKEKNQEEYTNYEEVESHSAKVIPWPDIGKISKKRKKRKRKKFCLEGKYIYYDGKKIPILQFQKAGYEKLLKLLVKEIGR